MNKILIPILIFILLVTPALAEVHELHYFGLEGCPHCVNLEPYLEDWAVKYTNLTLIKHDASVEQELFKHMLTDYGVPTNEWGSVPRVFISDYTCVGDIPCINGLDVEIEKAIEFGCQTPTCINEPEEMHLGKLMALAAADAVSPCELAVLTMLLTAIMIRNPDKKKKILWAGLAFALAVFSVYFIFGSLIVLGFKSLSGLASFNSSILYKVLASFAILLGLINLKDFFTPDKPLAEVPLGWRPKMRAIISKTASVPGAFVTGLIVSLFLTPCTIGPYFVAGGILSEMVWTTALPLLLVYNLIFILPMIGLVFMIYFGVSSIEKTSKVRKNVWKYTHLLIALLMFALGISMWMGWI
ncbi:MAG: hypothetical protein KJ906_00980 [Nanoarchaeota archaeon]|nr:hypothetical protein [Nanoarchaeota archaeon]